MFLTKHLFNGNTVYKDVILTITKWGGGRAIQEQTFCIPAKTKLVFKFKFDCPEIEMLTVNPRVILRKKTLNIQKKKQENKAVH